MCVHRFLFEHLVLVLWSLHPGKGLPGHVTTGWRGPRAPRLQQWPGRAPSEQCFHPGAAPAGLGFYCVSPPSCLPRPPHTLQLDEVPSAASSPAFTPSHWAPRPSWDRAPPSAWSTPTSVR